MLLSLSSPLLTSAVLSSSLEVSENKTTLTFTSSQDDKILEWILSCGPDAKPVEPNEFVQRWKDKICEMAELAGI